MIRGLLIFAIVGYLLFRFGKVLFKLLHLMSGERVKQAPGNAYNGKKRPADGNLNIDKVPKKPGKGDKYQGGEYVDYEEL